MSPRPPYRLHDAIGYQLTVTARMQERRFEAQLKTLDLTRITWCVLLAAQDEGLCHPSDIAAFIGIDRTATSRALRQMEGAGLITRGLGDNDRRTTRVTLTDLGRARLDQAVPMALASRNATETQLTPQELADLRRLLTKLRAGDDAPLTKL
ncbi:MarR family transcriptional regulator [Aliiroseovarius subalbicans]|uniref:MarR family winged helix-turn-helix transcriptional regulator n=1 Tax=Aliiroseovarius subalbicans TaxID=2925840 RepID=UPI001F569549|nr:MarR family transcriptional regulator [Aliiroseovarius subalbicans]MCI2398601.1 MarR family transcriptional regulator [Aliiroseovarius subalbicans]